MFDLIRLLLNTIDILVDVELDQMRVLQELLPEVEVNTQHRSQDKVSLLRVPWLVLLLAVDYGHLTLPVVHAHMLRHIVVPVARILLELVWLPRVVLLEH